MDDFRRKELGVVCCHGLDSVEPVQQGPFEPNNYDTSLGSFNF